MRIMQKVFQQFLTISRILAGIFPADNSSSKFGWYPAKPNFLQRIFGGKYNFGGYGEFSAAWVYIAESSSSCCDWCYCFMKLFKTVNIQIIIDC